MIVLHVGRERDQRRRHRRAATIARTMIRLRPSTSATAPANGAVSAIASVPAVMMWADLRRPGVEFARQFRQQRLRRIEIEEGAAAGDGDADAPVVEGHFARGHGWKRGRIMREAQAAQHPAGFALRG